VEAKDPAHYLYPHAVKLVEEARRLPTLFRQKATRADSTWPSCPTSAAVGWRDCFGGCRVLPELDLTLSDYGTRPTAG
jgi:hypothetical protein